MSGKPQPGTRCACGARRDEHPTESCAAFVPQRSILGTRPRMQRQGPRAALITDRKPSAVKLRALIEANAELLDAETLVELAARPRTRRDCEGGQRPCPWACRYSLVLEVTPSGSIKLLHPDSEPADSCALDVADRGEHTLEVVGRLLNVTRERARQIEISAAKQLRRKLEASR